VLTNAELSRRIATSDEWVRGRTGIAQRCIAATDEQTSDLALAASRQALAAAGIAPADLDLIVVATTTPDMIFPSTACILQAKLGASGGPAFDVQAVCSGFVYALSMADLMIKSGAVRNALVVGAEIYSRILDWNDRGTCVLFGDGAGAVVLAPSASPGILSAHLHADGRYRDILGAGRRPMAKSKNGVSAMTKARYPSPPSRSWPRLHTKRWRTICVERDRLADPASGKHPDHGSDHEKARAADGADGEHGCRARQHLGGIDSAGARRRRSRRAHPVGASRHAGRCRRRLHLGRGAVRLALMP
jgi:hypothetical protein